MTRNLLFDLSFQKNCFRRAEAYLKEGYGFLYEEAASRLINHLPYIKRPFRQGLVHGFFGLKPPSTPLSLEELTYASPFSTTTVQASARAFFHHSRPFIIDANPGFPAGEEGCDLILSCMHLQGVNNVVHYLRQCYQALKPDGLFLSVFVGNHTFQEIRTAFMVAEEDVLGGAHPHVGPFITLADSAALLQQAGFLFPVCDVDSLTLDYAQPLDLLWDVKKMGLGNCLVARSKTFLRRDVLARALDYYKEHFTTAEGRAALTVELIFMAGWRPPTSSALKES